MIYYIGWFTEHPIIQISAFGISKYTSKSYIEIDKISIKWKLPFLL